MATHVEFRRRGRRSVPALLALAALAAAPGCGRQTAAASAAYVAEVDAWHAQREERLRSETGWLTLVGLHELDRQTVNSVGSDPAAMVRLVDKAPARVGDLAFDGAHWEFTAAPGAGVTLADSAATPVDRQLLDTDHGGAPTTLACGTLQFFVIDRDSTFFLRVRDRDSEVRRGFTGIERYPVESRWRVIARLEGGPSTVMVPNVLGQESAEPSPGVLVFELNGHEYRLTPTGSAAEGLFLVFGDATNGHGTYGGGRFLSTEPVGAIGTVVLDFNRAYNPPCVFTPYATCPLPGRANTLPIAIEAGEKTWGTH